MPAFKNRVLTVLDRIYSIIGDQAPNDIETKAPITLVHDVSRDAGLGAALGRFGGYFADQTFLVHAGADTQYAILDPYGSLQAGFIDVGAFPSRESIWVWHLDCFLTLSAANLTSSTISLFRPTTFPDVTQDCYQILYSYASATTVGNSAGVGSVPVGQGATAIATPQTPVLIPDGGLYTFRSTSSGAMTNYATYLAWVGPKGVPPPGMR